MGVNKPLSHAILNSMELNPMELKNLKNLHAVATKKLDAVENHADIDSALDMVEEYSLQNGGVLPSFRWHAAGIFLIISLGTLAWAQGMNAGIVLTITVLVVGIIVILIASTANITASLSDAIFTKDLFLDNRLIPENIEDKYALYEEMQSRFCDFSRGDESHYIEDVINGHYNGQEHSFNFTYYAFHYMNVQYVAVPSGKTMSMSRQTYTRYRYGVIAPFPFLSGLAILSDGSCSRYSAKWKTSSKPFNDHFVVRAADQQIASRFLVPHIIVFLTKMAEVFSGLNIEITPNKEICISCSDDDIVNIQRKHSINDIASFRAEIKQHRHLPKLEAMNQIIHEMLKYQDNNFLGSEFCG